MPELTPEQERIERIRTKREPYRALYAARAAQGETVRIADLDFVLTTLDATRARAESAETALDAERAKVIAQGEIIIGHQLAVANLVRRLALYHQGGAPSTNPMAGEWDVVEICPSNPTPYREPTTKEELAATREYLSGKIEAFEEVHRMYNATRAELEQERAKVGRAHQRLRDERELNEAMILHEPHMEHYWRARIKSIDEVLAATEPAESEEQR